MKKHPLQRWRESHEKTITLADLSVSVKAPGVSAGKSQLSTIENWQRYPSLALACRLEQITGIPPRDFLPKAEPVAEGVADAPA